MLQSDAAARAAAAKKDDMFARDDPLPAGEAGRRIRVGQGKQVNRP